MVKNPKEDKVPKENPKEENKNSNIINFKWKIN